MMKKMSAMTKTKRGLAAVAVAGLGAAAGMAMIGGNAVASAGPTANLSVSQAVSNGSAANRTTVTDHIYNGGPSTAVNVVATALLKTNGGAVSYLTSNATCEQQPAPSGWSFMFTCQLASLPSGHTWQPKFTLTSAPRSTVYPLRECRRRWSGRSFPGQQLVHDP